MRICINAAAANQGGAVTTLLNLLPQLVQLDSDDRYLIIAPDSTLERLAPVLADPRFEGERYPHSPGRFARRILFDQWDVPSIARRFRSDLLYSSNGFGSLVHACPEALLVRNSIYFSRTLEARLRGLGRSTRDLRLRRAWSLLSMRRASGVLFPTRAMQNRVARYVSLAGKATRAIHYGFDAEQFFGGGSPGEDLLAPMRAWRAAGRKVMVFMSGYAVHKNFETAIEALHSVVSGGTDVGLVLTAEWKPFGEMVEFEAMLQRIRELGLEDHLYMAGIQPWSRLHAFYAEADLHLWPTFLESFGHPMVEAMASGLPTVASDTEVNREVLGDAARYFDTFDPASCAEAIRSVISDRATSDRLREAAALRVAHFTWSAHARELSAFFGELIGKDAHP